MRSVRPTLGVFALVAIVFTGWLGAYGLWDQDEGRHAAIARELYAATTWRGWIIPSQNFSDYHDKPILYYWLTGLAYRAVGVNELGARLVSALSALATLLAVFWWTATVWDARTARRAVLVLATSAGFICLGRYGSLDMLLACWITIGLVAAERYTIAPARHDLLVVAGAAAGFGMLTKGLVAPVFIAGVPLVHAALTRQRLPPRRAWIVALGVFALVAGPWLIATAVLDPGYLRELFLQHHVERFAGRGTAFHPEPWWYYAPGLGLLLFPWTLLLPAALAARPSQGDPALRYCLCWAGVVIAFFSCSHGKLATYILPALPPLGIVVARGLGELEAGTIAGRRLATIGLATLVLTLLAAAPVALQIDREPWDQLVTTAAGYLALFPLAAAGVLVAWRWRGLHAATTAVAGCMAAGILVFYAGVAPLVSQLTSARPIADVIIAHADAPIVSYAVTPASLLFYVGRPVVRLDHPRGLRQLLAEQPFAWIVTSPRHVDEIARAVPVYPWVTTGRRVLYATAPEHPVASLRAGRGTD